MEPDLIVNETRARRKVLENAAQFDLNNLVRQLQLLEKKSKKQTTKRIRAHSPK